MPAGEIRKRGALAAGEAGEELLAFARRQYICRGRRRGIVRLVAGEGVLHVIGGICCDVFDVLNRLVQSIAGRRPRDRQSGTGMLGGERFQRMQHRALQQWAPAFAALRRPGGHVSA